MNDLQTQKLVEELKLLKRPWYQKPELLAAYIAVFCTLVGVGFQYSLHDQTLLVAKNEKSLAEQEKVKAENEKFLLVKERIILGEKLGELKTQLKTLIEAHNKTLAAGDPVSAEAKEIITTNLQFLAQIEKQVAVVAATSSLPPAGTRYFSWVDSLLSSLFGLGVFILGVIFLYGFFSKKQPELFPSLIAAIKSYSDKKPHDGV